MGDQAVMLLNMDTSPPAVLMAAITKDRTQEQMVEWVMLQWRGVIASNTCRMRIAIYHLASQVEVRTSTVPAYDAVMQYQAWAQK